MGSHRKPRGGLLESPAARRGAVGVGAAALASATLLTQGAHADDDDSPSIAEQRDRAEQAAERAAEVQERVDALYHDAGVATQRFNEAEQEVADQQEEVDTLLDSAAQATERVNEARRTLGSFAAAQYRNGNAGLSETATLLLATDPQSFFDRSHTLSRLGDRQERALDAFTERQREAAEQRDEATAALADLEEREAALQEQKDTVQGKLADARALLDELSEEEREALDELERLEREEAERQRRAEQERLERERQQREAEEAERREREQQEREAEEGGAGGSGGAPDGSYAAKADAAIAFAEAQLGKPYVWGATGPNSYDCSGLTQGAWAAAGVDIPRVTWDQVNIGSTVARADLQPGDLVFFYDDISHVGLYIGNGNMIHAPRPGENVRVESIDTMPWHSAVRPA